MKTTWLLALALAARGAGAESGCGDADVPVTRRVVVTWNGLADQELFDHSVKAFDRYLGRRAALHLLGLGGKAVGQNSNGAWLIEPARRPEAAANQKIFYADAAGFLDIARAIRADFDAQADKAQFKPANYEIDFMVTNHGTIWTGPAPAQEVVGFGLGAAPPDTSLSPGQLQKFVDLLPEGVRFKTVSGVCYGGESTEALVEAVRAKKNSAGCACGVSVAAPSSVAKSVARTEADGTVVPPWEGLLARFGGTENVSLQKALWLSLAQVPMGRMGEDAVPPLRELQPVDNAPLSSSERFVIQTYSTKVGDWEFIEADAARRLAAARKDPNARTDNDPALTGAFAASKKERRLAAAELLGLSATATNLDAKIQEAERQGSVYGELHQLAASASAGRSAAVKTYNDYISTGEFAQAMKAYEQARKAYQGYDLSDARVGAGSDASLRQGKLDESARLKAAFDAATLRYKAAYDEGKRLEGLVNGQDDSKASLETRKAQVAVAKMMAREKLEEAFLRTAPAAQVERYERLRRCELETFGPGPEVTAKDPPRTGGH